MHDIVVLKKLYSDVLISVDNVFALVLNPEKDTGMSRKEAEQGNKISIKEMYVLGEVM